MTNKTFSRRNFIKLATLSLSSLAFNPKFEREHPITEQKLVRVAGVGNIKSVSIHKYPDEDSVILYQRYKDDLINVYYELESEYGPEFNPIWYRVWGGYVHRKWLVEVENIFNPLTNSIHADGQLGEITVPFTRAFRYSSFFGWESVSRLYYQSYHWIRNIVTGPDEKPWYELEDELSRLRFAIPAEVMRIVPDSEFEPISTDIPPEDKRIDISIYNQELTAYEADKVVFQTKISSGALTPVKRTPVGEFQVGIKMPSKHMGNGTFTNNIMAYELPGVPWNCFFENDIGIATHGTYWHNNFGTPMSSGCINMRNHDANWIFRWTNPVSDPHVWTQNGSGTLVIVH